MNKRLPLIIASVVVVLLAALGVVIWQKSNVKAPKTAPAQSSTPGIKKVDLASQPEWVQKLTVTAVKGRSGNGLDNVTVKVSGMPQGMVDALTYTIQYETSNKGTQGALATEPVPVKGATTWARTIDLGTCSTKSCVRHEGVKSIDVELDFTTSTSETPVWTGTLALF